MTLDSIWNISGIYFRYDDGSGEREEWFRMTPQEQQFAAAVQSELKAGRIPGPSQLNEMIGRRRDNNLHGRFSKIRRAIFIGAGLVKDARSDRWVRPSPPSP